jgi:hypothetical protein
VITSSGFLVQTDMTASSSNAATRSKRRSQSVAIAEMLSLYSSELDDDRSIHNPLTRRKVVKSLTRDRTALIHHIYSYKFP